MPKSGVGKRDPDKSLSDLRNIPVTTYNYINTKQEKHVLIHFNKFMELFDNWPSTLGVTPKIITLSYFWPNLTFQNFDNSKGLIIQFIKHYSNKITCSNESYRSVACHSFFFHSTCDYISTQINGTLADNYSLYSYGGLCTLDTDSSLIPLLASAVHSVRTTPPRIIASPPTREPSSYSPP